MSTLDKLIAIAIEEDVGSGDITAEAIVPSELAGSARIEAKEDIILAGMKVAEKVFAKIDKNIKWEPVHEDGDAVEDGELIAEVSGPLKSLLSAERIVLNFLQHLSGISTFTHLFVKEVKGTKTKILDTRKTHPGYRELEKEAVRLGDGVNHRMGLFDRYLIKNNHISVAGSVAEAIERVKKVNKKKLPIEVEVRDISELEDALGSGVDIIMLDNFTPKMVEQAIIMTRHRAKLEISGGVNVNNIRSYARLGVDFISIGALTHSAPAVDIHMLIES